MPLSRLADGEDGEKTYLQETMAFGVQGSLALKHVLILLRIYVLIWEKHRQAFQAKLHCRFYAPTGPKRIYIPNDLKRVTDLKRPCYMIPPFSLGKATVYATLERAIFERLASRKLPIYLTRCLDKPRACGKELLCVM